MNGGLIVGTMDGANIEIREECGPLPACKALQSSAPSHSHSTAAELTSPGHDTMFIFGCQEHEAGCSMKEREFVFCVAAGLDSTLPTVLCQVAGISARAQEGHYPIDGRLQACRLQDMQLDCMLASRGRQSLTKSEAASLRARTDSFGWTKFAQVMAKRLRDARPSQRRRASSRASSIACATSAQQD